MQNFGFYYINLKDSKDRLQNLKQKFKNFGDFACVEAVSYKEIQVSQFFDISQKYFHEVFKTILPAEVGCTLSHIKALQTFLQSKNKFAIIFEDDIDANDEIFAQIAKKAQNLDENFVINCYKQDLKISKYVFLKQIDENFYQINNFSKQFIKSAAVYAIDRKAAQEFLKSQEIFIKKSDDWHLILSNASFFYYPLCDTDKNFDTTIKNINKQTKHNFFKFLKVKLNEKLSKIILPFISIILRFIGYKRV